MVEYRIDGFNMFDEMVASIREDTSLMLLTMELRTEQPLQREQLSLIHIYWTQQSLRKRNLKTLLNSINVHQLTKSITSRTTIQ